MRAAVPLLVVDAAEAHGGAQRSLLTLLRGLAGAGFAPFLATGDARLQREAADAGIPGELLRVQPWRRTLPGLLRAARDLRRFRAWFRGHAHERPPALVYANGLVSGLLASLTLPPDLPLVFHHRDVRVPGWALRRVVRRAARTVVPSEFARRCAARLVGPALARRLVRVYNGFDFAELARLAAAPLPPELPAGRQFVVLAADLVKWKRHELFLDAFARAYRRRPTLLAVCVGGPRDAGGRRWAAHLRRRAERLAVAEAVRFCGHLDNALPVLRAAAVVCSAAPDEPFGRTMVEALALGRPVVAVRGGGPDEILEGQTHVQLVRPEPVALAYAVLAATAAGPAGRVDANWRERFSCHRHTAAIAALLRETLAARPD